MSLPIWNFGRFGTARAQALFVFNLNRYVQILYPDLLVRLVKRKGYSLFSNTLFKLPNFTSKILLFVILLPSWTFCFPWTLLSQLLLLTTKWTLRCLFFIASKSFSWPSRNPFYSLLYQRKLSWFKSLLKLTTKNDNVQNGLMRP